MALGFQAESHTMETGSSPGKIPKSSEPKQSVPQPAPERRHVFISYSHADRAWVERIHQVMAPLLRQEGNSLRLWDDSQIQPGERWQEEIETALARAQVALLLVSADFLASEFVMGKEVPALLRAAKAEGVTVLWVPLSACLVRHTPIHAYQAVLAPEHTLDAMEPPQQRLALVRIAEAVHNALRHAEEEQRRRQAREAAAAVERQRAEEEARTQQRALEKQQARQRRAEEEARQRQQAQLTAGAAAGQRQQQEAADRAQRDQARRQQRIDEHQQDADERQQARKLRTAGAAEGGRMAGHPKATSGFTWPEQPRPSLTRRQLLLTAAAMPLAAIGIGRVVHGIREGVGRASIPLPAAFPLSVTQGWLERQGGRWQVGRRTIHVQAVDQPLGNGSDLRMIAIPAGRFRMGSLASDSDEGPRHEVQLASFLMSQAPITQGQWRAVMKSNPAQFGGNPDGDQLPVEKVTWHDAMEFCKSLSRVTGRIYTLPSEAQWEYACRAGTTTPFAFGDTISPDLANYNGKESYAEGPKGEYRKQTTQVGMFPSNAWGLQDMHGNVWEWCLDHPHDDYEGAPADGSAWYRPLGLYGEDFRILRGGSWDNGPSECRSATRSFSQSAQPNFGFRVVCPQSPSLNS